MYFFYQGVNDEYFISQYDLLIKALFKSFVSRYADGHGN